MENTIGKNIKRLRKSSDISQEVLATALCVTVQAVSKWETEQSIPDVSLLPDIASFFNVSIDSLFYGETAACPKNFPDVKDDKLYIFQVRNGVVLSRNKWDSNSPIKLDLKDFSGTINAEIWGSAVINGDVSGNIDAGAGINCGNVGGNADAGAGINCGNVSGGADAGAGINCGNVVGSVDAGAGINCGNITGNVDSGGDIRCETISGNSRISCDSLYVKGQIQCSEINCSGDIHTEMPLKI